MYQADLEKDLAFLRKLQTTLIKGFEGDCVSREYAMQMVEDWIAELEQTGTSTCARADEIISA